MNDELEVWQYEAPMTPKSTSRLLAAKAPAGSLRLEINYTTLWLEAGFIAPSKSKMLKQTI
jgi:hypothetical protein